MRVKIFSAAFLILSLLAWNIDSAPISEAGSDSDGAATRISTIISRREPVHFRQNSQSRPTLISAHDYVASEQEYQRLLDQLRAEHEMSVQNDPSNYVSDNVDLESIIEMIESRDNHINEEPSQQISGTVNGEAQPELLGSTMLDLSLSPTLDQTIAECPICYEAISQSNSDLITECNHRFHRACLISWFEERIPRGLGRTCPLCRRAVISYDNLR